MEYTVKKLGDLAGVSGRTLRFYDEINLLKPARINSSGYRIYGQKEVDQLQQILFYRELGLSLESIQEIITAPDFNGFEALLAHHAKLLKKRTQLDKLVANVEKTIASERGKITMSNQEKFDGFKQEMIDKNEALYGKELRKKYSEEVINQSNQKVQGMSQEEYDASVKLQHDIFKALEKAFAIGDPSNEDAQKVAEMHKEWLSYWWGSYSKEAHAGLAQMYVDDERFTQHYDSEVSKGATKFLRDAILIYTGKK